MNCDCIYYSKNATQQDLQVLAKEINGYNREFFPDTISRITEKTRVSSDYDGYGKTFTIPADSLVLFASGKYHYMMPIRIGRRVFNPWWPLEITDFDSYEDIQTFSEDEE